MAIVGGTAVPLGHTNSLHYTVDIVAIPAILADPGQGWGRSTDSWLTTLPSEVPGARVLLYDHLFPEERALDIKPRAHADHQTSVEKFTSKKAELDNLGIQEWADRLFRCLQKQRNSSALRRRPIVFLCHSTGGIVVKQALSMKPRPYEANIAACCLWIAFFSTPHKGSSVLSDPVFTHTLRHHLCLKWEMSEKLRGELMLSSPELEHLNDRFCAGPTVGIQVSTYIETEETELEILTEAGGEALTSVLINVVDPQSAELATPNAPMEEDIFYMRATHINIAALADDTMIRKALFEDINAIVRSTNSIERAAHHDLLAQIMNDTTVDIHQFYQTEQATESSTTKIWTEKSSLQNFLDAGPSQILHRRFDHHNSARPSIEIQQPSTMPLPVITDGHARPSPGLLEPGLAGPHHGFQESRISKPKWSQAPNEIRNQTSVNKSDQIHKSFAFPAPSQKRDRFKWIHIPFSVTGWVGPIMKAISKDEGNTELSSKLLQDQLWRSQHNKSRHSSHHSRFVRSLCRVLRPREVGHQDEPHSPTSAVDDLQLAMFMPYLHWDSFRSLKARNAIIKQRSEQDHIRPVQSSILKGGSLEHKVIWQFLGSNMPVHTRRTLDGYGYPSLVNTYERDMDQVMFKRTSRAGASSMDYNKPGHHFSSRLLSMRSNRTKPTTSKKANEDTAYVLMVDELWMWILQDNCMITFATPKEKEDAMAHDTSLQADLRTQVIKDISGDFARQVDDCFDHAALLVFHAVRALLEEAEDPSLNVFRTFEEHISEIAELHTLAFKEFRDSHKINDPKLLFQGSHNLDYSSDLDNLLELRDVEDELSTIKKLFIEQKRQVTDMIKQYDDEVIPRGKGLHGKNLLLEAETLLNSYEEQVDNMVKSSKIAQEAFENLLDLKQKHSNIVEAHMTRYQTEVASEQSRSVMIFTIITIIFLPLSFFSSVFGMNVYDWSGTPQNPSLSYVLTIMGTISLAVVVVALATAFNAILRRVGGRLLRRFWHRLALPTWHLLAHAPFKRIRRVALAKELMEMETSGTETDLEKGLSRNRPPPKFARGGSGKRRIGGETEKQWSRDGSTAAELTAGGAFIGPIAPPARSPTDESEMDEWWKKTNM